MTFNISRLFADFVQRGKGHLFSSIYKTENGAESNGVGSFLRSLTGTDTLPPFSEGGKILLGNFHLSPICEMMVSHSGKRGFK